MTVYPDFLLGNWELVSDETYDAETIGAFGVGIILPVIIPSLLTSEYVRVQCSSSAARATWVQGCKVSQTINSILGANDVISEHLISLNTPEIIKLIDYPDGYRLRIDFYKWFPQCRVIIHQYLEN